jgi:hypothetical protein
MPSDTRPLAADIVIRKVSHFGIAVPATSKIAMQAIPARSVRIEEDKEFMSDLPRLNALK